MKTGLNNVSAIVQAIGESFSLYFMFFNNN